MKEICEVVVVDSFRRVSHPSSSISTRFGMGGGVVNNGEMSLDQ